MIFGAHLQEALFANCVILVFFKILVELLFAIQQIVLLAISTPK